MLIKPGINRNPTMVGRPALAGCTLLLVLLVGISLAIAVDLPSGNTLKGFKAPLKYFDPPYQLQVQSMLEGSEAVMANGTIVITNARLQTFHENGTKEMIMNAPQCVYDHSKNIVSSDGPLQVQTWDYKNKRALHLQGTNGFYWQQTNSLLIVSNQQSTTISGPLTNSFTP